jgi:hypothetical protein
VSVTSTSTSTKEVRMIAIGNQAPAVSEPPVCRDHPNAAEDHIPSTFGVYTLLEDVPGTAARAGMDVHFWKPDGLRESEDMGLPLLVQNSDGPEQYLMCHEDWLFHKSVLSLVAVCHKAELPLWE